MKFAYEIYNFLDQLAPFSSQMEFDNSGFLVGDFNKKVNRVLVALDITRDVVLEAKKLNSDLIISHHPVIFKPIKSVLNNSVPFLLSNFGIAAICAHTNLDLAVKGTNSCLANRLNLEGAKPLFYYKNLPLGLLGKVKGFSGSEFAGFLKKSLGCNGLRFIDFGNEIKIVAVVSGSVGDLVVKAIENNCDALVIGEIKHSDMITACDAGVSVFDLGHFTSENLVIDFLTGVLKTEFKEVEFFKSNIDFCWNFVC